MRDAIDYPAYYSMGLVGYEVGVSKDGETAFYRYVNTTGPEPNGHRAKVRYTVNGRPYFLIRGRRIHLDECLRKNI